MKLTIGILLFLDALMILLVCSYRHGAGKRIL